MELNEMINMLVDAIEKQENTGAEWEGIGNLETGG